MQENLTVCLADAERVVKKQKTCSGRSLDSINGLLKELQAAKEQLAHRGAQTPSQVLQGLQQQLKALDASNKLSEATKDLHGAVTRLGKSVDKTFAADICKATRDIKMDAGMLNQVIAKHLFQEGRFNVGQRFVEEAGVLNGEQLRKPFSAMHSILKRMKAHDLQPALQWAREHREQLADSIAGARLEFMLHRLQFLHLLQQQGPQQALLYARQHFAPFQQKHMADIKRLMGCLCFARRPEGSRYADLLSPGQWDDAAREFARQCCGLLGLAQDSPLLVTTAAGAAALPTLLKCAALMTRQGQDIRTCQQLPTDLELGSEFVFYSIFACPVSREQSTPANPPRLLPCGHVLCHHSILKIAKSQTRTFKCPYCPKDATLAACRELHFPDLGV